MAMKFAAVSVVLLLAIRGAHATASPLSKVIQLLGGLEAKINAGGEAEQKQFEAYADWCHNAAKDLGFEITTAKSSIEGLEATISKADSDISEMSSKTESLAADIATNEGDLQAASRIREQENKEFVAAEDELVDTIDILERATNVLERKLQGSAMLQAHVDRQDIATVIHTLSEVVDAAGLALEDRQKLVSLAQGGSDDSDDDQELGAPAAAAYKAKSGGILDVLEDLKQKAETQLDKLRGEETNRQHSFQMTKQSLEDQIKVDNDDLSDSKSTKADAQGTKASAEGELAGTKKDLAQAEDSLQNMDSNCKAVTADHEMSVKSRAEELKALAAAKQALQESTAGAADVTYSAASLLQVGSIGSHLQTRADLANFEVVNLIRKLAREQQSAALAQLATRISNAMRSASKSGAGQDPFAKVKALIKDMVAQLEKEGGQEAKHKEFCDDEYGETKAKQDELSYDIEKMSGKIDKAKSESARLKDEVATLTSDIASIIKIQAEADELRKEEHATFLKNSGDLKEGVAGVRQALKVLREYYASSDEAALVQQPETPTTHGKAGGSATGIIGMLEVVEADFGANLASIEMAEQTAATAYQKLSMENKLSKATNEQDVKYKSKEAASLDKAVTELTSDRDSAQTELDAVLEYSAKLRGMCEAKPESYEERKGRRDAELAGLKSALDILDGQAVLLQRNRREHLSHGALAL